MGRVRTDMESFKENHFMSSAVAGCGLMLPEGLLNLLHSFPALDVAARRVAKSLPAGWGDEIKLEALPSSVSKAGLASGCDGWIGMRTRWEATDPAVMAFTSELFGLHSLVPEPDEESVERLAGFADFERDGKIVAVGGVAIPAGEEQIRFFVTLRWRWLVSPLASLHLIGVREPALISADDFAELRIEPGLRPHQRHLLGYDAMHTTDETQQTLLTYSMLDHRQILIDLQRHDLPLFMAVWLRDFPEIEGLTRGKNLDYLAPADRRLRQLKSPRDRVIYGTAIMSEFERLFEIATIFKMDAGVSREAIERVLTECSSLAEVRSGTTPAHRFVIGMAAHTRVLHPTMNGFVRGISPDPVLNQINAAFRQTSSYWHSPQRLRKPSGEMPAMYFLGIEPQFLTIAGVMMMVRNLKALDRGFSYRGRHDRLSDERSEALVGRLGTVIMANICVRTARGVVGPIGQESDEVWLTDRISTLVENPALVEAYERAQFAFSESPVGADADHLSWLEFASEECRPQFKSQYANALLRVKTIPQRRKHGWTRGFNFEAWLAPTAEHEFLRQCCKLVQFGTQAAQRHENWTARKRRDSIPNYTGSPRTTFTGLPRSHPLEDIQDLLRPVFERLQYADLVNPRFTVCERAVIDAFVTETARLLPAVNPCTLDPHLNEQILQNLGSEKREFAVDVAWNA